jgi:hypothetical protein
VVLVPLADFVQVLFQLDLVQATRFVHEIDGSSGTRFHLFAEHPFAEVLVSLEVNLAHRSSHSFVNGVNNARCAAFFVDWIDPKLNADVVEAPSPIDFDDFLARLFQLLFVNRLVEFQFDFFAQSFRFDPFGSVDFDLAQDRTGLHGDDYLHSIALWLGKNANV